MTMDIKMKKLAKEFEEYAKANGFRLNPNKKMLKGTLKGLIENEKRHGKKYCPCRRITENMEENKKIICPCIYHKKEIETQGHCLCQLFVR